MEKPRKTTRFVGVSFWCALLSSFPSVALAMGFTVTFSVTGTVFGMGHRH